jgi:hypothetical protein
MELHAALGTRQLAGPIAGAFCLMVTATGYSGPQSYVGAEYHPGYGRAYAWRASVHSDGRVRQEVKKEPGMFAPDSWTPQSVQLIPPEQVSALFESFAAARLCSLDSAYSPTYRPGDVITDLATLKLELSVDGRRCRVSVYGGDLTLQVDGHPQKAEVRRFCAAWASFLAVVPAPNRWQTPDTCT